ncbi:hypothetical protein GCM10010377_72750 [Streptomyces viridiviolaceus]|uniref:Mycofactocin-associated electron transfer flavoprotein alpha subunit n=1 Tax=Streptomyces viridiviolaceus TaxID=68282 RepID=A0ABW2DTT1_9ACTN|nr:mycofactocin-associated electron transfer flavoprotein alpha subunit [Streptomyces viridiviolaceus]GHB71582.1 hypothetical protein GCM10010377_72750 [Streptomyces viridiviolaceus]
MKGSTGALGTAVAVVVVRDGLPPLGADEAVAEAGGDVLLVGTGTGAATARLTAARRAWTAEAPRGVAPPGPAAIAAALRPHLEPVRVVVLPASPDGRDLAPRLAAVLDRPLLAGAIEVTSRGADVLRWGDRTLLTLTSDGPFVATLVPGVRGVEPVPDGGRGPGVADLPVDWTAAPRDATCEDVFAPPPDTTHLSEAPRIVGAGAGLGRGALSGPEAMVLLGRFADAVGASVGATRVVTDAGWTGHERQVGTTGVVVDPDLYIAFGVSGAAQHVGGLGSPRDVISVNTDPYCPMTARADLGVVADAAAVLEEMTRKLGGHRD